MRKRSIARLAAGFLAAAAIGTAWAGPPFVTDDPEPVEHQHWEINNALTLSRSQGQKSFGAPSIDINYGLAPDVQIHAQPKLIYEETPEHKHYGIDSTEIGVKYRFFDRSDDQSTWMAGIYPMLLLPTADNTLSPGGRKTGAFLPMWFQRSSKEWTIYGGAGYRINQGIDARNSCFTGIVTLNHVTDNLQLGGEIFRETPTRAGEKTSGGFNLGGVYDLSERYHVLFSAGKGLINASSTNQFSSYLALQVTY